MSTDLSDRRRSRTVDERERQDLPRCDQPSVPGNWMAARCNPESIRRTQATVNLVDTRVLDDRMVRRRRT
jgi:hypothetical protein